MHRGFNRPAAKRAAGAVLAIGILVAGGQGGAGHSVGHFPSYYPDEVRVDAVDPATAGRDLVDETLHAYVGAMPVFAGPVPAHVKSVKSLGSFLVLSFNATSGPFGSADSRCAVARGILAALSEERAAGFVFHPYPVTPYHADYLYHVDRVEAARDAVSRASAPTAPMKVGAKGRLAETIVRARWGLAADRGDVTLEEVAVDDLLAGAGMQFVGWSGPPWVKEGWYQAHRLLAPGPEAAPRRAVEENYERLIRGETLGLEEQADVERRLVAALTDGCERVVVGYALRQEFVSEKYPAGIENVAYDSLSGLNAPVFLRTVKLKEYPWNGKLHLAVRDRPQAAWNPVAGFTDVMGRLIWSAVGDPAMIQFPSNASWMPNRIKAEVVKSVGQSGIRLPADAVRLEPGTGALQRVGARTFGSAKVVYEVLASPFEDGTEMEVADLLYPFVFAYRWGATAGRDRNTHEPRLEPILAALQERVVGLKVLPVKRSVHDIAEDLKVIQKTPVLEVYLRNAPGDDRQLAALAPPWSTVPWHLLALMEEAVIRGYATFSEEEAARRKLPWLDLVRDQSLGAKLQDLILQFESERYRPEALMDLVTGDEAQARWSSLRAFAEKSGHFLVTNGPYRLKEWKPDSVVLEAVRDLTYPLGFGTFDHYVNPPKAVIETVTRDAHGFTVSAAAEMILKMGREYRLVKEPLLRTTARGTENLLVAPRYLLIGPDGQVLKVDKMRWNEDGRFTITLPERLPPGQYTVVLGIFLDGNTVDPSVARAEFRSN